MDRIKIEKKTKEELQKMGVFSWPTWEKEVSTFDWHYDDSEQCYILEGKAQVEPASGKPVEFGPGDFVTFPKGMDCKWTISQDVRKHYTFL
jgi:hypothetical protein